MIVVDTSVFNRCFENELVIDYGKVKIVFIKSKRGFTYEILSRCASCGGIAGRGVCLEGVNGVVKTYLAVPGSVS